MKKFRDGMFAFVFEHMITDHLFPPASVTDRSLIPFLEVRNIFDAFNPDTEKQEFTRSVLELDVSELLIAAKKMSSEKACGPSSIPNEILKRIVIIALPRDMHKIYECLKSLSFPAIWEKAKLVFLHKGVGNPVDSPSSFHPICLVDTPGKLLERFILQILEFHLDANNSASRVPDQFGF
jgi:hypothetical protein